MHKYVCFGSVIQNQFQKLRSYRLGTHVCFFIMELEFMVIYLHLTSYVQVVVNN